MSLDFRRVAAVGVARHFGRRKALSQITLTCEAGEIVGLLGPNGAGKSTLLSVLATLAAPSSGRVEYGEVTPDDCGADIRRRIGLLGHDLFLYPELTARENLAFFAALYGLADAAGAVSRALDAAGLSSRADDLVQGFSRGMRQRLALERALLHDPRLILLDEPFTGLDPTSAERLAAQVRALAAAGRAVVLVTHDLARAAALGGRALLLVRGRVAFDSGGTPASAQALEAAWRSAGAA